MKTNIWGFVFLLCCATAQADTSWVLGAGIGHVSASSYPGAKETASLTSPIPYLKIKTDWFDLDREGLHTHWFEQTNFRLDFTFDLGLPVQSKDIPVRQGMDDLDLIGLIGPMLIYRLNHTEQKKWQLQLPLAYAYSFDNFNLDETGWTLNPRIYYARLFKMNGYPFDFSISTGPVYNSKSFNQYYYRVDVSDATITRPAYESRAGYAGWRMNVALTKRSEKIWAGVYFRYQTLADAVFEDSPLVAEKDYWFIAFGVSWLFAGNL